jgi:ABC-type glycerol-3-phosphate transport system substrate-binding protein
VQTAAVESEHVDERAVLGGPDPGGVMVTMQMVGVVLLAVAQGLGPLGARAANLVVWWDKGYSDQEDAAVREVIAAFEQKTGKQVELSPHPMEELPDDILATIGSGRPPDFAFDFWLDTYAEQWAYEGRLVDLSDAIGHFSDLFDPAQLNQAVLLNGTTGGKALYGLPVGQITYLTHVWKSLLKQAGFTLEDIPREWDSYWSFWCDQVQPGVRLATGRDDIWGVGLPMSIEAADTLNGFGQFQIAYDEDYVTPDGRLVIHNPEVRGRLVKALDRYMAIYRKGCTLEWPLGPSDDPFAIIAAMHFGMAFNDGASVATAKEFVHFLVADGWLAHYLDFSGERMLPSMPKAARAAVLARSERPPSHGAGDPVPDPPRTYVYSMASGDPRHALVNRLVWARAVPRVAAEGISPIP